MATEVISGPFGEVRAASTAGGGTALTTTAAFIQLPLKTSHVTLIPRNFSTAVVVKFLLNPWLTVLKVTDNGVGAIPIDYSNAAQDASATTDVVLSSLDTLANGDFLLVGSHQKFRGAYADVDAANGTASDLTVTAPTSSMVWTSVSATDGTANGGAAFAVDGLVSWTVPTDWPSYKLTDLYPSIPSAYYTIEPMYWTRWEVSAALDTSSTLNSLVAANRSTAYAEISPGFAPDGRIRHGFGGIGCVEVLTDAGTANLIVDAEANGEFV